MATYDVPVTMDTQEAAYSFCLMIMIDCKIDLKDFLGSFADCALASLFS